MPNGRSGGFRASTSQLKEIVGMLPRDSKVGAFSGSEGVIVAADLLHRLELEQVDDLAVWEHDHSWYLILLGADRRAWVVVEEDSYLHGDLKRLQANWHQSKGEQRGS